MPPFPDVGIIIAGAGGSTELLAEADTDGTLYDMFSIKGLGSGRGIRFQDIRITYTVPESLPTTTPVAIRVTSGQNVTCHRMYFNNCFTAMYLDNGSLECGVFDSTIVYNNWGFADKSDAPGLLFLGGAENYVLNCIISQTPGVENVVGIIVSPAGGAIFITNCHISDFTIGIWIQAGGTNLARVFGSNVICESLTSSLYIVPIVDTAQIYQVYFSDCSFGAANDSADTSSAGVIIDTDGGGDSQVSDIFLNNCMCYGWSAAGVIINKGQNIVITGGRYGSNKYMSTGAGISITGTAANVTVNGADLTPVVAGGFPTQPFALSVTAAVNGLYVHGCNMTGYPSSTGPVFASSAGSQIEITNCPGYNDQTVEVTASAPASGARFNGTTYGYYGPTTFYIIGTGITAIKVASSPTATAITTGLLSGAFRLDPGEWGEIDKGVGVVTFALIGT
jgi:hypothetical protein